jgi:hypothetical protein
MMLDPRRIKNAVLDKRLNPMLGENRIVELTKIKEASRAESYKKRSITLRKRRWAPTLLEVKRKLAVARASRFAWCHAEDRIEWKAARLTYYDFAISLLRTTYDRMKADAGPVGINTPKSWQEYIRPAQHERLRDLAAAFNHYGYRYDWLGTGENKGKSTIKRG